MSCHLGLVHIPRGTNTCPVHLLDNKLVGSHVDLYIHFQLTKNNNNNITLGTIKVNVLF